MSEGIGRKFQVGARNLLLLGILEDKLKCPRVPQVKVHFVCLDISPFSAKITPLNLLLSVEECDWEDGLSLQWPTRSNFIRKIFEFKIRKQSMLVLKQTIHQQKALDLTFNIAP